MGSKGLIRKKYLLKRKKNYFNINKSFFLTLIKIIKRELKNKEKNIAIYYPSSFEVNILKILELEYFKKFNFLLPVVDENDLMNFHKWKKNDVLHLNKYGIPEPVKTPRITPSIILVPLIAFDNYKNRIGYGKGFYDKYLARYSKINKKILSVGIAFSFQKYHKLPINYKDFKLNYIITEKGIIK